MSPVVVFLIVRLSVPFQILFQVPSLDSCPALASISSPTPRPISNPTTPPILSPALQPVSNPTPQPISNPAPQPISSPASQPISSSSPGPISKLVSRPVPPRFIPSRFIPSRFIPSRFIPSGPFHNPVPFLSAEPSGSTAGLAGPTQVPPKVLGAQLVGRAQRYLLSFQFSDRLPSPEASHGIENPPHARSPAFPVRVKHFMITLAQITERSILRPNHHFSERSQK